MFAIDGPVAMVGHCHCAMCRKSHGSAFATFATVSTDDFRWVQGEDRVVAYQSSAQRFRRFCARCGSAVLADGDGERDVLVPLGNVAGDPGVRPRLHAFTASMAPWHTIVDDLPRHGAHPQALMPRASVVVRPGVPRTSGAVVGSCLCGAVAYEFDPPPLRMYNCHCSRCRRTVSAAYQTVLRVDRSGFRWLAGAGNVADYRLPGTWFQCAFCRTCGSRTPWTRDEQVCVPAGSLDCDPGERPHESIFTDSRAVWAVLDERLESWPAGLTPTPDP
ncbi:MAG: GFA family protein [Gammaproteobacteria bacterium]|nr:GFA family protein [Gammaproteobacteria bacterium]